MKKQERERDKAWDLENDRLGGDEEGDLEGEREDREREREE